MFCDIKDRLDDPVVHKILSHCVFENSPKGIEKAVNEYRQYASRLFYGWIENGELLGVCGFEVHSDYVEIRHISVDENTQRRGIGRSIVTALREKYKVAIEAETDNDAVAFYRKTGFDTTAIRKYDVRRWVCRLPVPDGV